MDRELGISIEGEGTSGKKHLCGGRVVLRAYVGQEALGWGLVTKSPSHLRAVSVLPSFLFPQAGENT